MSKQQIEAPDVHYLNSAIGWLELGNLQEAQLELESISLLTRYHPDVLLVRWKVFARLKNWARSLDIARALVKALPSRATGWICLAYSLYNTRQMEEAWEHLLTAEKRFPEISAIPYFLACLACQLGRTEEAAKWLARWNGLVKEGGPQEKSRNAPRLKPIWQEFDDAFLTAVDQRSQTTSSSQED